MKPNKRKKRRPYPPKHRTHLAQKARENQPWKHATGPKTTAGKATAAQNATKSGLHTAEIRALRKTLSLHAKFLRDLGKLHV